jgi:iron transport multicopper oxidase
VLALGIALALAAGPPVAGASSASLPPVTNAGDGLRDGWYPDEPSLTPQLVTGGTFGQLWTASVNGQVYAQPLLSNGTLVVATENDEIYGLDPATGATQWSHTLGTAWKPADIGCGDITPSIGTTATPVIDPNTNTVYVTYKTYASGASGPATWYMDALDVSSGATRPGFPVALSGTAQNEPGASFNATNQQQRPGLLLTDGVVYAGFGSHCDYETWQGWVFGVSTAGHVTARWVDNAPGSSGAGIWQAGVGLMSDAPGSILVTTGNGGAPSTPTPGNATPPTLGESVVRLDVQTDGTLKPVDFFAPFDAQTLDSYDADFGSGGIVGLNDADFGTAAIPHLGVMVGKGGYVYLLNLDSLGGYDQGSGGSDDVVQRIGPRGGVWGRAGVWPGDGGYVYIPTSSGSAGGGVLDVYKYGLSGSGQPSLALVATSADVFGWGSGPPVITSDGTTSGSAVVWDIWAANRSGSGGQLRAYAPVPVDGVPVLLWSASIGNATNYSTPGVGAGRLYVGTRDGKVIAFGSPTTQPLVGPAVSFPATITGTTSDETLTLTAQSDLKVTALSSTSSQFVLGKPSQALPATLAPGQTISVPVAFSPTQTGLVGGAVNASLGDGSSYSFAVSGIGQPTAAQLAVSPPVLSMGGTAVGDELSGTVSFSNVGGTKLTINSVDLPAPPFSASGVPADGDTIAPGGSITVDIAFDPTVVGQATSSIGLSTTGGDQSIGLSGSAGTPGDLQISGGQIDFGSVAIGTTVTNTFSITNTGGTDVTITKSKPPFGGEFAAATSLPEGTTIGPGVSVLEQVTFTPTSAGSATASWQINGDDISGLHQLQFSGTGVAAANGTVPGPGASPAGTGGSPGQTSTAAGAVERLLAARVSPAGEPAKGVRGLHVAYTASAGGITRFTLAREVGGRREGGACVRLTRRNRGGRHCNLYITVATFSHIDTAGANRFALTAFVRPKELTVGVYSLRGEPGDVSGAGPAVYLAFRVGATGR